VGRDEGRHAGETKVDTHVLLRRHGSAVALGVLSTVYPVGGETEGRRLNVVVMQALRRMQDVCLVDAAPLQVLEQVLEIPPVRLVGVDRLVMLLISPPLPAYLSGGGEFRRLHVERPNCFLN